MKTFEKMAAQGDMVVRRLDALPDGVKEIPRDVGAAVVVTHSETGHNHEIRDQEVRMFEKLEADPLVCFLQIDGAHADLVHCRPFDTHETLRLLGGGSVYEVRRQREYTPQGWRRVQD